MDDLNAHADSTVYINTLPSTLIMSTSCISTTTAALLFIKLASLLYHLISRGLFQAANFLSKEVWTKIVNECMRVRRFHLVT